MSKNKDTESTERFKKTKVRPTIRKETGCWQFELRYKDNNGKWRCRREPTGIKATKYARDAFSAGKSPKAPPEVEKLREELSQKIVDDLKNIYFGPPEPIKKLEHDTHFFEYVDEYRKSRRINPDVSDTTKKGDESRYRGIKKFEKFNKPISEITSKDCSDFFKKLADDDLSGNTIQQYRLILNNIFQMAIDNEKIRTNPMVDIKAPKQDIHKVSSNEVIDPDLIFEFLMKIKGEFIYPCVLLALCLGLRRSELLGLRWENIHIVGLMGCKSTPGVDYGYVEITHKIINCEPDDKGKVYQRSGIKESFKVVKKLKTESSRREIVIVNQAIKSLLIELFNKQQSDRKTALESWNETWGGTPLGSGSSASKNKRYKSIWDNGNPDYGYICVDSLGEIITPGQIDNQWKTLRKKYKEYVGSVKFHGLRHTYATYLVSGQVPIWNVSKMLGHATVNITDNFYVHAKTLAHAEAIKNTKVANDNIKDPNNPNDIDESYVLVGDTYVSFF